MYAARECRGDEKTPTAWAECVRADFFRPRTRIEPGRSDFDAAIEQALVRGADIGRLPGCPVTAKPG